MKTTHRLYIPCLVLCYSQVLASQKSRLVQNAPNYPSRGPKLIPRIIHHLRETMAAVIVPDFLVSDNRPHDEFTLRSFRLHIEAGFWLLRQRMRRLYKASVAGLPSIRTWP